MRRGETLLKPGETNRSLYLIRTGALEIYDSNDNLLAQFSEGDWAGHRSTMLNGIVTRLVKAIEDTLLYVIPSESFSSILKEYESVRQYFSEHLPERLRYAIKDLRDTEKAH